MKVFFISETHRADAQTWLRGLKEYGDCDIETWEIIPRPGPFSRLWRIWDWLIACLFLGRKIRKSGADILLSERITSYGFIGAFTNFHPFVAAQQGITDVWPMHSFSTPFKAFLARYAYKKADLIQAWGEVMVPAMLQHGANPSKIKVLAKGIDLKAFNFKADEKQWDKIRGIVTRSLTPDYNHKYIIEAIKILKDRGYQAEIIILGDGFLMPELMKMTKDLDLNDVIKWIGRVPNLDIPTYLSHSNMYISTPISEGVSASLFEAMASGSFPIVTDLPGTSAWIKNGENGFLVPVNNSEKLADAIIEAWKNQNLMKMALQKNRLLAEEHADFSKNIPIFLDWYKELISLSKKSKG